MVSDKETRALARNLTTLLNRKRERAKERFYGWFLPVDEPEPIILPDDEDGLGD